MDVGIGARLADVVDCPSRVLDWFDPEIRKTVVHAANLRRGLRSKCNLYSTGPSCGSASSLVIPQSASTVSRRGSALLSLGAERFESIEPHDLGHGEDTRGGSGS